MGATEMAAFNAAKKFYDESLAEQRALRAEQQRTNQLLQALLQALAPQAAQPAAPQQPARWGG